ncbi:MAG: hypothetical protein JEZ02_17190 [Desulfatibacillum sp.]|nr:hypothetical protein [Desulfatibacillum sp.]
MTTMLQFGQKMKTQPIMAMVDEENSESLGECVARFYFGATAMEEARVHGQGNLAHPRAPSS